MPRKKKMEALDAEYESHVGMQDEDLDLIRKLRAKRKTDLEALDKEEFED